MRVTAGRGIPFDRPVAVRTGKRDLPTEQRNHAFRRVILTIASGKVSTYGRVAAAAGYPLYHRAVARLLQSETPDTLPWHRVVGAGGVIKLRGPGAVEQKARLELEGVCFAGRRVDTDRFEQVLRPWE